MKSSFSTISFNNGVLTINGVNYKIKATGNTVTSASFEELKLENNVLKLGDVEIVVVKHEDIDSNFTLSDDKYLVLSDGQVFEVTEPIE